MTRRLRDTIDRILFLIPVDRHDLRSRLMQVAQDAGFRAPELSGIDWRHAEEVLVAHTTQDDMREEWCKAVRGIWNDDTGRPPSDQELF